MTSTTGPRRSPEPRPTRRVLLASAALVAPATLLPAIAAAAAGQEPDRHPALGGPDGLVQHLRRGARPRPHRVPGVGPAVRARGPDRPHPDPDPHGRAGAASGHRALADAAERPRGPRAG